MLIQDVIEKYLEFLEGLGIHEAWLSETKPTAAASWKKELVITEEEHTMLVQLQDRYNKQGT